MSDEITHGRVVDITIDPVAGPSIPDNIAMLAPRGIFILYGTLDGKALLDLQPTLRLSKNSPAARQFTIHTWDNLVEERRAGMNAQRHRYARCRQVASAYLCEGAARRGERMKCWRAVW
jgi:NADPH:quinone reductase-like Zn-dependent oxidoreductase